jgi:bacillithiol synthase
VNTFLIDYTRITTLSHGFSQLFTDYTSQEEARNDLLAGFFHYDDRREADYYNLLGKLAGRQFKRDTLRDLLLRQNREFGVDERHLELLDKLRSPRCMLVVTGQQPGLFSGPLYTIYKALSAIVVCEQQKEMFPEYDFLPLFWIESDDHDFEESAQACVPGHLELNRIVLDPRQRLPGQMVSRTVLSEEAAEAVKKLAESLQDSDCKEEIIGRLNEFYKPGATLESGFARTMAWLMKDYPLFFLAPGDRAFKELGRDMFLKELSTCPQSSYHVVTQSSLLEQRGYSTQAKPRAVNLFYINDHNQRQKIEQDDHDWFVLSPGRRRLSRSQILELCGDHPERFSPNVVLRPVVQDYVLPVFAYIAGPGEISYLAQYRKVYEHFGLNMPFIMPRGSFTLVEPAIGRVMDKVLRTSARPGFSRKQMYETAFSDMKSLRRRALAGSSDHDYDELFETARKDMGLKMEELLPSLLKLDPTLEQSLYGTMKQVEKNLDGLLQKVNRANRRKHDELLRQIDKTALHLFPEDSPQERVFCSLYYINKYGPGLLDDLAGVLRAQSTGSHIVLEL